MMPGITPSLLMADTVPPFQSAYVSPPTASWYGSLFNYYTDLYVEHSGGVAPFTYAWSADGWDVEIVSPNERLTRVRSTSGDGVSISCQITDAVGQSVSAYGTILYVSRP